MLLFTSIITLFISFVLLYHNWKSNKNVIYLSFLFILTSLFGLSHYFVIDGHSRFWLAVFFNHFAPLMLLIGPFLFFYVRNVLYGTAVTCKKDCFHSIPTLLALAGSYNYFVQPFEQKLIVADRIIANLDIIRAIDVNYFYDIGQSFALRCFMALAYLIYCFYLFYKTTVFELKENQMTIIRFLAAYRWLIILLLCLCIIFISFTILTINSIDSVPSKTIKDGYVLYLFSGFAYCAMSLSLLLIPETLYGINSETVTIIDNKRKMGTEDEINNLKYLSDIILKYLEEEKPFLNSDFSISDIALHLKVPQIQISNSINYVMETKFSKLKSKLRIRHALELLKKGTNSRLTIEAIGEKSGFKTRSHFYSVFKDETGLSPNEYLKNINK